MARPADGILDLEAFRGLASMADMQRAMCSLAVDSAWLRKALSKNHALATAAAFGSLLTEPGLQSNCCRLEMLVHQALALGRGLTKPAVHELARMFEVAGEGRAGRLEDPAEDVFVALVRTPVGGFRVLEGIAESAGFFLQRFIGALSRLPREQFYVNLRASTIAMLRLSDLVCERAGLQRYDLGEAIPQDDISAEILTDLAALQQRVRFTKDELAEAGIDVEALAPFFFDLRARKELVEGELGGSPLEKRPLVLKNEELFVLLPSVMSGAIRHHVLGAMGARGELEVFLEALGREYLDLFSQTPLVPGTSARLYFHRTETSALATGTIEIDAGRYLHLLLVLDTLEGIEESGLSWGSPDPGQAAAEIEASIKAAQAFAKARPGFVDGTTLAVSCGVGRAAGYQVPRNVGPDWRIEVASAPELETLAWAPGFETISLWRLRDAKAAMLANGVRLQNINGLVNLVAWARSQGGHLVPLNGLPEDFADRDHAAMLAIPQNALLDLRHEVALHYDVHMQRDVAGQWRKVRRFKDRLFAEDDEHLLYVDDEPRSRRGTAGLFLSGQRAWWFDASVPDEVPAGPAGDYWKMVMTWIIRAAPVLEQAFPLLPGSLLVDADFVQAARERSTAEARLDYPTIRAALSWSIGEDGRTIHLVAGEDFEAGGFNVDNIAEQALVGAIVGSVAELAGRALAPDAERALVDEIVPDPRARHRHAFTARSFTDFVHDDLLDDAIIIDEHDHAMVRLGLAWRVREPSQGNMIEGKADCISFLNALVASFEDSLCEELRAFDRTALVSALLYNHETAAAESSRWKRTAAAVLALRKDKDAARAVIAEKSSERAEVSQTSRLLIEMAICACPIEGGREPGALDLSQLMAKIGLVHALGGWSGAMRWDVLAPWIKISPLGDIQLRLGEMDGVLAPFARAFSDVGVDANIERYAEHLEEPEVVPTTQKAEDKRFYEALADEWGLSFDDVRFFVDIVEDLGVRKGKVVFPIRRSELAGLQRRGRRLGAEAFARVMEVFALRPRANWRETPDGFDQRDIQAWRYRRRLSPLRRPLVQLDDAEDPTLLVAPGLLRQSLGYSVQNFYEGGFPDWQLGKPMRSWQGRIADKRGAAFSSLVAEMLRAEGWEVETEVKVSKILRKSLDRNYGDVDVLAWRGAEGRVLIVECKDVQFRKTLSEIAEQLAEFRGEVTGGKPDYLRRHLDRVDVLREHLPELGRYVGISAPAKIESHLVFKNPVPMEFALAKLGEKVTVSTRRNFLGRLDAAQAPRASQVSEIIGVEL